MYYLFTPRQMFHPSLNSNKPATISPRSSHNCNKNVAVRNHPRNTNHWFSIPIKCSVFKTVQTLSKTINKYENL